MPVACQNIALTGADGLVTFTPAGVSKCLKDFTDFPKSKAILPLTDHGFKSGDVIKFSEEGSGKLDSAVDTGNSYGIGTVSAEGIQILYSGSPVSFKGDGGTGTADSSGHIRIQFAESLPVSSVQSFQLSLSKDQVDVTTLPSATTASASGRRPAPVRKQQGTFMSGEGSMEILFTKDQASMGNRLLADSVMQDSTCRVKLYVDTVFSGSSIDENASSKFECDVTLLGFDVTVNTSDALVATVNFSLAGEPISLFNAF